ncbi:ATP-binding cassette domain-containing protein [Roseibium sp.]|uniref:ATP-binding cassette domain-containing protein n=1 Tax=Roseibium sp. TaxID=1936156 RepID=UPI003BB008AB
MTTRCQLLKLHNLSIGWGQKVIAEGLNLEIDLLKFNRRVPIIGRTGIGKTTLLYSISMQSAPMSGSIAWHLSALDMPIHITPEISGRNATELRSRIFSFAFQDSMLVPYLTVLENIALPLKLKGVRGPAVNELALSVLSKVLIGSEAIHVLKNQFPETLSGGQRQRIALAQALATDPAVLFSDEPTGSLDPDTRKEITTVINRWLEENQDRVYVWITHHRDSVEFEYAPYLLFLDKHGDGFTRLHTRASSDMFNARREVSYQAANDRVRA